MFRKKLENSVLFAVSVTHWRSWNISPVEKGVSTVIKLVYSVCLSAVIYPQMAKGWKTSKNYVLMFVCKSKCILFKQYLTSWTDIINIYKLQHFNFFLRFSYLNCICVILSNKTNSDLSLDINFLKNQSTQVFLWMCAGGTIQWGEEGACQCLILDWPSTRE